MKLPILLPTLWLVVSCHVPEYNPWYFDEKFQRHEESVGSHGMEDPGGYLNEWTVEVEGGPEVAQLVAMELGYVYGGEVLGFPGTYVFFKDDHSVERRNPSAHHTANLAKDRRVRWADQLFSKTRVKRNSYDPDAILHRVKRIETTSPSYETHERARQKRSIARDNYFDDELWSEEWYLQDTRTRADLPRLDLNVLPVYALGINGSGVRVTVLDDGIEHNHTDLRGNYDAEISWDCNDRDPDPMPKNDERKLNSHGTRCAGEIAMMANNKKCGVGVAWGARVGGVRLLDGQITDRIEGEAIGYAWDKVDIYSASWGPDDNGRTVEGPGRLAAEAFKRGVTKGRGGKGVIFVWANGNGGGNRDNCNCDGYSSNIYTISIASASQHGLFPWYGEICTSTLATAYSSGAYKEQKIATTDIGDSCTLRHTGTSAAAPLAAGIIALALSANPNLTWRDVQHLIVWTSEYAPLSNNPGWQTNGVGLRFDIRFGYGLLNAGALVTAALNWTNVPKKTICRENPMLFNENYKIATGQIQQITFQVTDCSVNYIEHIEVIVSLQYSRRGALKIFLTSPQGTKVPVLSARPKDTSNSGFLNWSLTSVATWGENPKGFWIVTVADETSEKNFGVITSISLVIHGTNEMPEHMKQGPRVYDYEYNAFYNKQSEEINDVDGVIVTNDQENEYDPRILDEVENELLRIHHRNSFRVNNSL